MLPAAFRDGWGFRIWFNEDRRPDTRRDHTTKYNEYRAQSSKNTAACISCLPTSNLTHELRRKSGSTSLWGSGSSVRVVLNNNQRPTGWSLVGEVEKPVQEASTAVSGLAEADLTWDPGISGRNSSSRPASDLI